MSKLACCLSVIAALVAGAVTPAHAQAPAQAAAGVHPTGTILTPTWDASLGYQLLHVPDQTFPFGLNVDGARNFGPWSIAAEAGWAFDSSDDLDTHAFNVGGGPRWTARSTGPVWPFVQVFAGFVHSRVSTEFAGIDVSDSTTRFMLQPGAGAVFIGGDGWGIVGQADYRRVFLDEEEDGESGENDFRVFVGLRVILD